MTSRRARASVAIYSLTYATAAVFWITMRKRVPPPHPEYVQFLSPFEPRVRDLALETRKLVLEEAPDCMELIYDAYNAVATGFSFTGRPSDSFIHIAVYARWVNLGFNRGSALDDPAGVLQGSGRWIRHI